MPTYEYACRTCGEHLEVVQSFREDTLTECPACGGSLRKVFGNIGIAFKGSGFYKTDSRSSSTGPKSGGEPKSADTKSESTSGDTKSGDGKSAETKSDSKSGDSKSGESKSAESKSGDKRKSSSGDKAAAS